MSSGDTASSGAGVVMHWRASAGGTGRNTRSLGRFERWSAIKSTTRRPTRRISSAVQSIDIKRLAGDGLQTVPRRLGRLKAVPYGFLLLKAVPCGVLSSGLRHPRLLSASLRDLGE